MSTELNPHVKAWTTEDETAVIWGTHDVTQAKAVYRALYMDTEPDWEDFQFYWGRPGLAEQETWATDDFDKFPGGAYRVPFLVFEF